MLSIFNKLKKTSSSGKDAPAGHESGVPELTPEERAERLLAQAVQEGRLLEAALDAAGVRLEDSWAETPWPASAQTISSEDAPARSKAVSPEAPAASVRGRAEASAENSGHDCVAVSDSSTLHDAGVLQIDGASSAPAQSASLDAGFADKGSGAQRQLEWPSSATGELGVAASEQGAALNRELPGTQALPSSYGYRKVASTAALAAVLATTLATSPVHIDHSALVPEPVPIVKVINLDPPDEPPAHDDEQQKAKKIDWLKILKFLLVALLLVASLVFGAVKGCAGCAGSLVLPPVADDSSQDGDSGDDPAEG